jgi:hypothetical protein
VLHVEYDCLALGAACKEKAALGVEGDAARAGALVRPAGDDGACFDIDRQGGRFPQMGIGAAVCRVDDQRFRPAGYGDEFLMRGHRRSGSGEREDFDTVLVGLGHPDLTGRRDPAHVVGAAGEVGLGDDGLGSRVDHHQFERRAVNSEDQPTAEIRRGRPFTMALDEAPLGAEAGDRDDLPADRIDEVEIAGAAGRNEELAEGGKAQIVETDAAFAAR